MISRLTCTGGKNLSFSLYNNYILISLTMSSDIKYRSGTMPKVNSIFVVSYVNIA